MQHPFAALAPEYASLLAGMKITRADEVQRVAERLLESKYRWAEISQATGVPIAFSLASFEREASNNYRLSPAQGDPWDRPSVNVPRKRGPFPNFKSAAIDAYALDHLDQVGAGNWTWTRACYEGELFNGFGYRAHNVHSPYDWSGTDVYDHAEPTGKYKSDGEFTFGIRDQQLGIIPVMVELVRLDPSLALADGLPGTVTTGILIPGPQPVPLGLGGVSNAHDATWIQSSLNALAGANVDNGLAITGNYDRHTKRAVIAFQEWAQLADIDGIAGPKTIAALEQAIAQAGGAA